MRKKPYVPGADEGVRTEILLNSPLVGESAASNAKTLLVERNSEHTDPDRTIADRTIADRMIPEAPVLPPPPSPVVPKRAQTVEMISMKTPAELDAEKAKRRGAPVQVQLRSIAEASRHNSQPPGAYGYLAPPRPPARGSPPWLRYAGFGAVTLAIAAVIATAIWFLAL